MELEIEKGRGLTRNRDHQSCRLVMEDNMEQNLLGRIMSKWKNNDLGNKKQEGNTKKMIHITAVFEQGYQILQNRRRKKKRTQQNMHTHSNNNSNKRLLLQVLFQVKYLLITQ